MTKARILANTVSTGNVLADGSVAASEITGVLPIASGGTGAATRQEALDLLAGAVTSGQYLRGNGTDVVMSQIQAADVPVLNQNTTGSAATLANGRTIALTGDVAYTSASFNGSANVTGVATLATVNSNTGTFGSSTQIPSVTVNAKGLVTAISTTAVSIPSGAISVTGGDLTLSGNTGTAITNATLATVGTAGTYTKVTTDSKGRVTSGTALAASDIPALDASKITSGTIDAARLPSYVDDVIEASNLASFPATGETGKIYVARDTNKTYRWGGSAYVFITSGAVDSVAGKTGVVTLTSSDVGLGSVENKSSATIRGEITSTNVTTALGFTPYNATNPSSYITTAGARSALSFTAGSGAYNSSTGVITIPTNTSQLTNGAGYTTNTGTVTSVGGTGTVSGLTLSGTVTGSGNLTLGGTLSLTSSQVTTALGFTPYNATNPSGYTTNTGTVTSVSGTGNINGITLSGSITSSGSITLGGTLSGVSLTSQVSGTLPVSNGGTGTTSLTANNVILGNGTSAVQVVAPGTSGNLLTSNGTTWVSQAPTSAGGLTYVFTTTAVTATDKQGVLADTSSGSFTVTLPAAPSIGAQVVVADAGASWGTNNLTVSRNGYTIAGLAENLVCDITGASVQFVYDGTTWEIYSQIGGVGGTPVTLDGTQTLTNKTITFTGNTLTGVASTSTAQTLTNKTISFADNTLTGVVGTTSTQTLTNKTIEAGVFTNGYTEETVSANTGTAYTIDLANGTVQILTLTGNCTYTFPTATAGRSFILIQKQDSTGSRTVTWPAAVKWPGGTAPTITATASKSDKFIFTADGTNWVASNAGQNYTL
jgi:hypothetical protein